MASLYGMLMAEGMWMHAQVEDTPSTIMARAYVNLQENAIVDAELKTTHATTVALQQ